MCIVRWNCSSIAVCWRGHKFRPQNWLYLTFNLLYGVFKTYSPLYACKTIIIQKSSKADRMLTSWLDTLLFENYVGRGLIYVCCLAMQFGFRAHNGTAPSLLVWCDSSEEVSQEKVFMKSSLLLQGAEGSFSARGLAKPATYLPMVRVSRNTLLYGCLLRILFGFSIWCCIESCVSELLVCLPLCLSLRLRAHNLC